MWNSAQMVQNENEIDEIMAHIVTESFQIQKSSAQNASHDETVPVIDNLILLEVQNQFLIRKYYEVSKLRSMFSSFG